MLRPAKNGKNVVSALQARSNFGKLLRRLSEEQNSLVLALMFLALEELRARSTNAEEAANAASKAAERFPDKSVEVLRTRLLRQRKVARGNS